MFPAIAGIQILLGTVILTLTALLVFVGVQVVFILRDLRATVKKINGTLDKPQVSTRTFLEYLLIGQSKKQQQTEYQVIDEEQTDEVMRIATKSGSFSHITELQERGRRVFHREGKPLA